MPVCKGTDPSFLSTELSYKQRGKKGKEKKKHRLPGCLLHSRFFFQSVHVNGTIGDFQFLHHHCQEQANGASQRQTAKLQFQPHRALSSFITLCKRCHTCLLLAVFMNQQRAAEEWPPGHLGKNQVPADKVFIGDLHCFRISLYPLGGTGQRGAFTYLRITGQTAKKRCCHAEAGGRISSLLADAKYILVPVISPKTCISKSNVWSAWVLSWVAAYRGTGEWNVKGHAQPQLFLIFASLFPSVWWTLGAYTHWRKNSSMTDFVSSLLQGGEKSAILNSSNEICGCRLQNMRPSLGRVLPPGLYAGLRRLGSSDSPILHDPKDLCRERIHRLCDAALFLY